MATPKTTGSLTVKSTSTVDAPLDYSTDFTTKFTYTESTSAGANAFMIHSDTIAVALSLKGTSDDILIIDGYSGDYTAKLSGSKLTLENSHQRITVALAAKSVVTLKFLDGNKEVNLQEKTLGGESLITKTGVLHINGMNAHELTSVTAAVTAALTDVNRKTYTTVDAAIISDNAIVASKALTDKLGKSYATVDAAIISDNAFVISNALIDKSGKSYLTVDVAITEAKTQALAPYTSLDQAIQSNDNAMIAKALTDSGTGFTTIAELAAAYKLLTPPIIPTFKVESLNAAMAPTITAAVNEGQKANFKISLQGNRGTNDYSVKTLLVGTSGATNDDFASTLTLDSLSSAAGITFNSTTGELKIPAQVTIPSAILTATVNNDNVSPESGEKLNLTLSDPQGTNATLLSTATTASFAITDTTSTFNVNSVTPTVLEGATASFVVNLLKGASATGDYSVKTTLAGTGLTDTSKATANVDFANTLTLDTASLAAGIRFDSTTGVLSIPATATVTKATLTTTVATDNVYPETSEGLSLTLSAVSGVNVALGTSVANTTITETPPAPTFSVSGSATVAEGANSATFTINLANPSSTEVYTVKAELKGTGLTDALKATAPADFASTLMLDSASTSLGAKFDSATSILTIPAGGNVSSVKFVTGAILTDKDTPETGEGLSLTLSEAKDAKGANVAIITPTANTLITDVTPPTFTVTAPNATVNEGANASFIVNLANRVTGGTEPYTVTVALVPTGGATAADYDAITAFTLDPTSIAAGITLSAAGVLAIPTASTVTSVTLTGALKSDLVTPETGEGLSLKLSALSSNAIVGSAATALTNITDIAPTLTTGTDTIISTIGNSTFNVDALTLNASDSIDDASTTDADILNITTNTSTPAATIKNIETINLTALNTITVDMKPSTGGFSGVKAFNIKDSTAPVTIDKIPDANMALGLSGVSVNQVTATYLSTALANDKLLINLNAVSNADVTVTNAANIGPAITGFELAELNAIGINTLRKFDIKVPALTISGNGSLAVGDNALVGTTDLLITHTGSIKLGAISTTKLSNLNASTAGAITADNIGGASTGFNATFSTSADTITITGNSSSTNTVKLGIGNDILNFLSSGAGNTYIFGEGDNDTITASGSTGTNYIDGGAGNDSITGSSGTNVITGGDGSDTITVNGLNNTITDFTPSNDTLTINLNATTRVFTNATTTAYTAVSNAGVLYVDGASTYAGNTITNSQTITGSNGADSIIGGIGNDSIDSNIGADTVDGGVGNDTINGGNGDDSLIGNTGNDFIIGGLGTDTINGGADDDIISTTNALLFGGTTSAIDSIEGGDGIDSLFFSDTSAAVTITLSNILTRIQSVEKITTAANSFPISITIDTTNQVASTGSDFTTIDLSGDTNPLGVNVISSTGANGISTIIGSAGIDQITLNASASTATITGGAGNDLFNINNGTTNTITDLSGTDSLTIGSSSTTVNATVTADYIAAATGSNAGALVISTSGFKVDLTNETGTGTVSLSNIGGAAKLVGGAGSDTISGGFGADTIIGGAGSDSITGGLGDDLITGGAGSDTINVDFGTDMITDFTLSEDSLNINYYATAHVFASTVAIGGTTNYTSITNNGTLYINGATLSDGITIVTGAETITGSTGADSIIGGAGNDSIVGGEGSDTITGGQGTDTINLTETTSKIDTIIYSNLNESGDSIIGFVSGTDKIQLAKSVFTLGVAWNGNALVTTSNANNYAETATALTTNPLDLNGTGVAGGAGIIAVGAASGTGGVSVYYSTDIGAATTNNSTLLLTLTGISTVDIAATDFIGV